MSGFTTLFWRGGGVETASPPASAKSKVSQMRQIITILNSAAAAFAAEEGGKGGEYSNEQVCEGARRLAELVLYSEQNLREDYESEESKCLELFFSQQMVRTLAVLAKRGEPMIQLQALQTLSILAQSLHSDANFFQFLSQNYVNSVLAFDFSFTGEIGEELLAHLVSLMKTLALRLSEDVIYFFFDGESFPLYDKAAHLFDCEDSLVRATMRSVILQVHLRCFAKCEEYIVRQNFFSQRYCEGINARIRVLEARLVRRKDEEEDRFYLETVQTMLQDVMDDWSFLGDVMSTMSNSQREEFSQRVLAVLVAKSAADAVSLWMLAQCLYTIPSIAPELLTLVEGREAWFEAAIGSEDEQIVQAASTICYLLVNHPASKWISAKERLERAVAAPAAAPAAAPPAAPLAEYEGKDAVTVQDALPGNHAEEAASTIDDRPDAEDARADMLGEEQQAYPMDLAQHVLMALLSQTSKPERGVRPVTIRLLAKLLVHIGFDSNRVILTDEHLQLLSQAIGQVSQHLLVLAESCQTRFVNAFEDEWHELKSHPPLQISSILVNANGFLQDPPARGESNLANRLPQTEEESLSSALQVFLLLRLSQVSLAHNTDQLLPTLGTADVVSVNEESVIDMKRLKKFFELQTLGKRYLMVLVAGALLLVEPSNGQCRSVCPIHRVEVVPNQMLDDPRVLLLSVRSSRRIGLATRLLASSAIAASAAGTGRKAIAEYRLSLRFESEAKSLFAREHIERSSRRAAQGKLDRMRAMLQDYVVPAE